MKEQHTRSSWGTRLGFILATSGAAIGLGNIQRFPYITAQCGGAVFVFIYLLAVIIIGLPLMLVEFSLGRHSNKNPVGAINAIRPGSRWKLAGALGIFTAFFILTYYSVVAGWTLGYIVQIISGNTPDLKEISSNPLQVIGYTAAFIAVVMVIVNKGVKKGIERYSKILMPILFILLLLVIARSLTLPGSLKGLVFYLSPDFSEVNGKVFLYALSQAFFSLCVGEAVLVTYGSYTSKNDNLVSSAWYIALFDTLVALLSGLAIFPALSAFGENPNQGMGLTFSILPKIFQQMPFGSLFGAMFFLLLAFAALTTSIALLEIPVSYLVDSRRWSRKKAVTVMGSLAFLISIPSALSKGASPWLSTVHFLGQTSFYDIMDFIWGDLAMVTGGFFLAIFTGWVWGTDGALKELRMGAEKFTWQGNAWAYIVKYIAPVIIFIILMNSIFN